MGKVYVGQSFTITLDVNQDITQASAIQIKVRKPGTSIFESIKIDASVVDAEKGVIKAKVSSEINNSVGKWSTWAYITFPGNSPDPGEPFYFLIHKEGS